jgi:glycosyltransferase involved in cell wall biosynthesis
MRILFVSNQLPHPPRNGVTVPFFYMLKGLSVDHDISLLYVSNNSLTTDYDQINDNKKYVNNIWVLKRTPRNFCIRIISELTCQRAYFQSWNYANSELENILRIHEFDIIWVTPFDVVDIIDLIVKANDHQGRNVSYIAGVNDCTASAFRNSYKVAQLKSLSIGRKIFYLLNWIRSWPLGEIETRTLKKYSIVHVQTKIEQKWLNKISKGQLSEKTLVLSNGVNPNLFRNQYEFSGKNLVFLGNLGGMYSDVVLWLLKNVWCKISSIHDDAVFHIVGQSPSKELMDIMSMDDRVVYKDYCDDILDIYYKKTIMLAPVFKNYGLINKVIESMAAGVPVVGDSGSFNGIPGFKNGEHGIVANEAHEFVDAILALLSDVKICKEISESARKIALNHFSWSSRISAVNLKLLSLVRHG